MSYFAINEAAPPKFWLFRLNASCTGALEATANHPAPEIIARKITDDLAMFCELTVDPVQLSVAADFVRQSVAGPGPA